MLTRSVQPMGGTPYVSPWIGKLFGTFLTSKWLLSRIKMNSSFLVLYVVIARVLFSACWDPLWWIKIVFVFEVMNAVIARVLVLDCFYLWCINTNAEIARILFSAFPTCRKRYSFNHFVWYLKRKFIFEASQNVPNNTFPIPALITSKQKSLGFITTYRKYYCCHHCICHHPTSCEKTRWYTDHAWDFGIQFNLSTKNFHLKKIIAWKKSRIPGTIY